MTGQKECSCEHHPAVSFVRGRSYASSGCVSGVWINLCWDQRRDQGREESSWKSSAFGCRWWRCRFVPCCRSACGAVQWGPTQTGNVTLRTAGVGSHGGLQVVLEAGLGSSRYILPRSYFRDEQHLPHSCGKCCILLFLAALLCVLCLLPLGDFCGTSRVGADTATFTPPVSCPLNSKACTALPCLCKGVTEGHRLSVFRCNFQTP